LITTISVVEPKSVVPAAAKENRLSGNQSEEDSIVLSLFIVVKSLSGKKLSLLNHL